MPDQVLQRFEMYGVANTPWAPAALRMSSVIQVVKRTPPDPAEVWLLVDHHTENSAVTDEGTGCVQINLLKGTTPVSSFTTCTPRNAGRGFQRATVRDTHEEHLLPVNLDYDSLGFVYYNSDHGGTPALQQIGEVVRLAAEAIAVIKNAATIGLPTPPIPIPQPQPQPAKPA